MSCTMSMSLQQEKPNTILSVFPKIALIFFVVFTASVFFHSPDMELLNPATPMAASPLRTSLTLSRLSSKYLSEHTRRDRVFLRRRKFNGKSLELQMYGRTMRALVSVGSVESDVVSHQSNVNGALEIPERSENLFDDSFEPPNGPNDFDKDLQELFDEVKRMIFDGRNSDAADLLKANLEVAKEVIDEGAKGIEEAATLDIIALGYMALGEFKIVGSLLNMMNGLVQNLKDDEPHMAPILMHMGSMYSTLRKFEKSILMYRRAVGIQEKKYGKSSSFLVTPLLGLAKAMGSIRRVTKAIGIYNRALSVVESNKGADSGHLLVPLFSLGNLLLNEGKADDAEIAFQRIVTIYGKLYGEKDGRVGLALSSLARAKCAKGDVEGAIISYKKALQIVKDSNYLSSDDSVVEKMRIDLAELLHMVGRSNEGRELLEECLLVTEQCKGKGHPKSVTHLLNLATSYTRSQNYVDAERLLRTSLEIMNTSLGPEDPSISFPMLHLAIILYNLKRDEEAEELALEVLQIREKAFGKDSFPVGEALDCLVSIRARSGKDDTEVLGMLETILKIQERELGYESEEVIITVKKIVFYLNRLGRKDEKLKLQKRLNTFREKNKGEVRI